MLTRYAQAFGITALTTFGGVAHARQNLREVSPAVVDVYQQDTVSIRGEQPYQAVRINPVLHEWDFEVGPELFVNRKLEIKRENLRESSTDDIPGCLLLIALGIGFFFSYYCALYKRRI